MFHHCTPLPMLSWWFLSVLRRSELPTFLFFGRFNAVTEWRRQERVPEFRVFGDRRGRGSPRSVDLMDPWCGTGHFAEIVEAFSVPSRVYSVSLPSGEVK